MTDEKNKNSNKPITLSLKVVIYLGIVSGIFLGSWEIVNNIPKYEFINREGRDYIFNKINGNVYLQPKGTEMLDKYGYFPYNLIGKISEKTIKDERKTIK